MKRIYCLKLSVVIILGIALLWISSCSSVPIGSERIQDPTRYLEVNDYVNGQLGKSFYNCFPTEIPLTSICKSYLYGYDCAFGGMPSFFVSLKLQFDNVHYFQETDNIVQCGFLTLIDIDGIDYVIIQGSQEDFDKYFDSTTEDGRCFEFQIVAMDESNNNINYLYARLYDGATTEPAIQQLLNTIASHY